MQASLVAQVEAALAFSVQASHCHGLSLQRVGCRVHGFSGCGARAWLFPSMWGLPGSGIKPVSPALAGRFLTTGSPGKSSPWLLTNPGRVFGDTAIPGAQLDPSQEPKESLISE